ILHPPRASASDSEFDEPIKVEDMASTASKGVVTSRTIPSNKAAPPPLPTPVLGGRSNNTRKELPLREYMPSSYICFLEGSLLSNGDLKGLWRLQRGDTLANEFLMVLMDRGVYEGGFHCTINLQQAVDGGFITQEIRDDWFGVDWCATTEHTSNIWGRGGNVSFGKYYLLGSHDATTGEAILYKVDEAEVRRAKAHCVSQRPPTCLSTTPLQWQQQQ
ncbi:unnamed protein product, partial [Sphacelaria rigidula]